MAQTEFEQSRDANDPLEDLFNDEDATFDDLVDAMEVGNVSGQREQDQDSGRGRPSTLPQDMLGVEQEVTIKKVRVPVPKLDETRLTSAAGVPRLQKIAKTKMRFRGKSHEFSDVAMLLRTYQLWLHDLYPRAKFHDGLTMIEKLGHTKSVQRLRCEWINESKPKTDMETQADDDDIRETTRSGPHAAEQDAGADRGNMSPDENIAAGAESVHRKDGSNPEGANAPDTDLGFPDDDDLDQLLAEEFDQTDQSRDHTSLDSGPLPLAQNTRAGNFEEDFAQDEEIMREMEIWD